LPDLVDEEVQAEVGGLLVDVVLDLIGEVFDGDPVFTAVFVENTKPGCGVATGDLGIGLGDVP